MRLEMVIGLQIEIRNGIKKLPFYGSFQKFQVKRVLELFMKQSFHDSD